MRPLLACIVVAAVGCRQPARSNETAPPAARDDQAVVAGPVGTGPATYAGVLTVPASVRSSAELTAHLVITNPGPGELVLTRGALELAMLALEVRDAHEQRVPTMPPPVPRPEDGERVVLTAGQIFERHYRLDVFSPPLAAGTYALRCRIVACLPRPFTVGP